MKKLFLYLALTLISLNTMAMGFPQNRYVQHKALIKTQKTINEKNVAGTIEEKFVKNDLSEISIENETNDFSLVEMISDFIVKLFCKEIFSTRNVTIDAKEIKLNHFDFVAIKQDFEYSLIG